MNRLRATSAAVRSGTGAAITGGGTTTSAMTGSAATAFNALDFKVALFKAVDFAEPLDLNRLTAFFVVVLREAVNAPPRRPRTRQ
jgi:hypothetical protein